MEWTRGPILGRGSTATVTAATSTSGDLFAVKSVDFRQVEALQKEQHFLSVLKSPYVISYKGCDTTREHNNTLYNIFIEHMAGGSVTDLINRENRKQLTELEIARYTRDIVKGLEYIQSNGIVHCDIKGRNILVDEFGAKIGDFGCARWVDDVAPIRGTPMFMAPEVALGEEQGFAADVWALGCTVIEMATGGSPWPEVNDSPWSMFYIIGVSDKIPEIPDWFSDKAKDFVQKCLIRDPKRRWTATELLEHPFLEIQELDENAKQIKCEKIETGSTGSPTSILDQDVWNSTRESSMECVSKSLRQKIEQLAGESEVPNWRCEKGETDWVTVRTIGSVTR